MHNHPERDEPPFWPAAVVLVITIMIMTAVILGFDGIATLFRVVWEMIKSVFVTILK